MKGVHQLWTQDDLSASDGAQNGEIFGRFEFGRDNDVSAISSQLGCLFPVTASAASGDFNGDGVVGSDDLVELLIASGPVQRDSEVRITDLLAQVAHWGLRD